MGAYLSVELVWHFQQVVNVVQGFICKGTNCQLFLLPVVDK